MRAVPIEERAELRLLGRIERPAAIVIQPPGVFPRLGARELWRYRGLLRFLVWRDIKVRYAQTALGVLWAIAQPLLMMLLFTVVFGRLAEMPSDGVPYALFALAGLVPWFYFSTSLAASAASLLGNANLVTKIYFPRIIVPLSPIFAGLLDLAIAALLVLAGLLYYATLPKPSSLTLLPPLVLLAMMTSAGAGLWLSALNVRFRDVKYVLPFLTQLWMYGSPIVYPTSLVPREWRGFFYLNPLAAVIDGFRAVLVNGPPPSAGEYLTSFAAAFALLASGLVFFRWMERSFADVI